MTTEEHTGARYFIGFPSLLFKKGCKEKDVHRHVNGSCFGHRAARRLFCAYSSPKVVMWSLGRR